MMAIVGSRAVQLYYNDLRTAGAQVRKVLMPTPRRNGASTLRRCRTEPSVVINPANGQRLTYGEIAAFGTIPAPLPAVDAKELKARKDFRLIGKSRAAPRHAGQGQRHGAIRHRREAAGHGLRLDAALAGAQRAAHLGSGKQDQSAAAPESWNDAEIKAMKGVIGTVKLPNGVAVVADRFERAQGRRATR